MRRFPFLSILCLLLALIVYDPARAAAGGCERVEHKGGRYVVCAYDPAQARIRIFNRNAGGVPYGQFEPLFRDLLKRFELPVFAMNGGMYEADLSPVGLYVEAGRELKPVNTRKGPGNFHLMPNGVFWLGGGKAGVSETKRFVRSGRSVDYATQSGPMLVVRGRLHPAFRADSDSLKIRNGVGVDRAGLVHFAVSEDAVRFHDFATLFRDRLRCPDALFLDGSVSSVYAPDAGRYDRLFPLGPIIAVTVAAPDFGVTAGKFGLYP
jgi:uncharacterized protein YigE (DUF2233 family)